jgi:peptide chain release factor 1
MFDKLEELKTRFDWLTERLSDSEVFMDLDKVQKLSKERNLLEPIINKYNLYKKIESDIKDARAILEESKDSELRELAQVEIGEKNAELEKIQNDIKIMLIPKDPYDDKNIYIEIRAGTGGDEASLFAADLLRMYSRYSELLGWKTEVVHFSDTGIGGFKEVILLVKGNGAYSRLKYEAGGHRVQRIPTTEAGGRIHTSACTVAVLPEADEIDVSISADDLRIDVFRASGAGGQHVNKTESAVRLTHIPTGIVVSCQDERSQVKNKEKAMKILRAKILEMEIKKRQDEISTNRKLQVGSGDRSDRIRTYNFPQNRVTDHRVNITIYSLDRFLNGELDEIIEALMAFDQAERLKAISV